MVIIFNGLGHLAGVVLKAYSIDLYAKYDRKLFRVSNISCFLSKGIPYLWLQTTDQKITYHI